MSSRALHESLSPRHAAQRRTRNGWLVLASVMCLALLGEIALHLAQGPSHSPPNASTMNNTIVPPRPPPGCAASGVGAQQAALAALPRGVALPADIVPLRLAHDEYGTLIVMCTATPPQASHDAIQHALLAHGWQSEADTRTASIMSLAFLRDGVVIFVTIAPQTTTPPTTQVVVNIPR